MSLRIQTNIEAFDAHRNLVNTVGPAVDSRWSGCRSGFRINQAADDAAGLAISEKLQAQIGGLDQAQRNAQDAVSLVQTAEGAMAEVQSMLQRVRDLAVAVQQRHAVRPPTRPRSRPRSRSSAPRSRSIGPQTKFNGIALLTGDATITFQVGADDGETIAVIGVAAVRLRRGLRRSTRRSSPSPAR